MPASKTLFVTSQTSEEACGACWLRPSFLAPCANIKAFVALMCLVIAVQGTYLGYAVGVQISIERRFEVSNYEIGILFALYDIGHTLAVMLTGYFGATGHKAKWTGYGVLLSGFAMLGLSIPHFIYGATDANSSSSSSYTADYIAATQCQRGRDMLKTDAMGDPCERTINRGAYAILAISQFIAGIAAAPFNTLAYVYIDDHVSRRQSPFYLGLLTSMYAFGPALGFGLSAICNHVYADLSTDHFIDEDNPHWIGAWWLGYIICAFLYFALAQPLLCFPKRLPHFRLPTELHNNMELQRLNDFERETSTREQCFTFLDIIQELPRAVWNLLKNPVYTSMVVGWTFGAYMVGGYGTYLPKFIEYQYHQTPALADIYSGILSIGAIAASTALGGFILTNYDIGPRKSLKLLIGSWTTIVVAYLVAMALTCDEVPLHGQPVAGETGRWNFTESCNARCSCNSIVEFEPVCSMNEDTLYFSPCHAGCVFDDAEEKWSKCRCLGGQSVTVGFCEPKCKNMVFAYLGFMFVALFFGNLFFMTTMMIILRSVHDDLKSLALSFASFCTNILGFIPSPIVFGGIIDSACTVWHSSCGSGGNCIMYDNRRLNYVYHGGNAVFQFVSVLAVVFTYFKSLRFQFPEEDLPRFSSEDQLEQAARDIASKR